MLLGQATGLRALLVQLSKLLISCVWRLLKVSAWQRVACLRPAAAKFEVNRASQHALALLQTPQLCFQSCARRSALLL